MGTIEAAGTPLPLVDVLGLHLFQQKFLEEGLDAAQLVSAVGAFSFN